MLYFDTSFLVPLILEEPTSASIESFVQRQTEELATSHWTRVEVSSLLAREVRTGGLAAASALAADDQLEAILSESFRLLPLGAAELDLAKQFLRRFETGLRAGDALHLAIAANRDARRIYTLDKTMLAAGRRLGLPVGTGIRVR